MDLSRLANPGRNSVMIARNGASASSWQSTPMPPSQVRWMSRYDGGRLSLIATVYVGSRGLLMRWNWVAHPLPGEPEPLHLGRLDERREVVEQQVGVEGDPVLDEPLLAQPGHQRRPGPRSAAIRISRPIASGSPPALQPGDRAEVEDAQPSEAAVGGRAGSGSCRGAGRRAASRSAPVRRTGTARTARRSGPAPPGCPRGSPRPASTGSPATR